MKHEAYNLKVTNRRWLIKSTAVNPHDLMRLNESRTLGMKNFLFEINGALSHFLRNEFKSR